MIFEEFIWNSDPQGSKNLGISTRVKSSRSRSEYHFLYQIFGLQNTQSVSRLVRVRIFLILHFLAGKSSHLKAIILSVRIKAIIVVRLGMICLRNACQCPRSTTQYFPVASFFEQCHSNFLSFKLPAEEEICRSRVFFRIAKQQIAIWRKTLPSLIFAFCCLQ